MNLEKQLECLSRLGKLSYKILSNLNPELIKHIKHLVQEGKASIIGDDIILDIKIADDELCHNLIIEYLSKRIEIFGEKSEYYLELINYALEFNKINIATDAFVKLCKLQAFLPKVIKIGETLLEKVSKDEDKALILRSMANFCSELGQLNLAEIYYQKAIDLYIKLSKSDKRYMEDLAKLLNNVGNVYADMRKYDLAEESYKWSANLFRELNKKRELAVVLDNLAVMYTKRDMLNEAERVFAEIIEIKKELAKDNIDDAISLAMSLNNLGVLYRKMKKFKEVEDCYRRVIKFLSKFKDKEITKIYLASAYNNLGSILIEQGKIPEGVELLNKVLSEYERHLDLELKMKTNLALAKGLEKLNDDRAPEYYFKAALLSYLLFREYGMQTVNFIHLLERVEKLAKDAKLKGDAKLTRLAILKLYYDKRLKELPEVKCGRIGELILKAERGKKEKFEANTEEDKAILYLINDLSGIEPWSTKIKE